MADSKNKTTAPNGWYLANINILNGKGIKIIGAELLTEAKGKNERTFCLWSPSLIMKDEPQWKPSERPDKKDWYFKIANESELRDFFNY